MRVINAFVESLNLTDAGFIRTTTKETGRPSYDPNDLLKLYVYGYFNRILSSRKLTAEYEVTSHNTDQGLLKEVAQSAKETLEVETIETVADKGYIQ